MRWPVASLAPRRTTRKDPMARRTVVRLVDDIDGSDATETVVYGLDGRLWEIDLSAENAADLRDVLAPYLSVSRPHRQDLPQPSGRVVRRRSR